MKAAASSAETADFPNEAENRKCKILEKRQLKIFEERRKSVILHTVIGMKYHA